MQPYTLEEAKAQLEQLIADAQAGKTIIIADAADGSVQLVPLPNPATRQPRRPGSGTGEAWMSPDFDAPLPDFDDYMP